MSREGERQPPLEFAAEAGADLRAEAEQALVQVAQSVRPLLDKSSNYETRVRNLAACQKSVPKEWILPYDADRPETVDQAIRKILEYAFDAVRDHSKHILQLDIAAQGEGFTGREGQVSKGDGFILQIDDEDDLLKTGACLAWAREAIKQVATDVRHSSDDLFKAHVAAAPRSVMIVMDPGRHKEFIGTVLREDGAPEMVAYQHIFSAQEKVQEKTAPFRRKYIESILDRLGVYHTRTPNAINGICAPRGDVSKLTKLLRLAASVKDLDLQLHEDNVDFAVRAFEKGVTNVRYFLNGCHGAREGRKRELQDKQEEGFLNPDEQKLLQEYRDYRKQVEQTKAQYREKIGFVRRAKDLNYEILRDLLALQEKGRQAASGQGGRVKKTELASAQFREVVEKLSEMEKLVGRVSPVVWEIRLRTHSEEIAEKYWPDVEAMDEIQKGGDVPYAPQVRARFDEIFKDAGGGWKIGVKSIPWKKQCGFCMASYTVDCGLALLQDHGQPGKNMILRMSMIRQVR